MRADSLYYIFLDTTDIKKLKNEHDYYKLRWVSIVIDCFKTELEDDSIKNGFINDRRIISEFKRNGINQIIEGCDSLKKGLIPKVYHTDDFYPQKIGVVYNSKDAYACLFSENFDAKNKEPLNMTIFNMIRIKNKCLNLHISFKYYGAESVRWNCYLSETWAKAILEANK